MKYLYVGATADIRTAPDREALAPVRRSIAAEFGVPVRAMRLPAIEFAYDLARRQHGSIPVLEVLLRVSPPDALKLLAVTARDLFMPVLTFVYGQAQLSGRVAVVSLARLHQPFYGLPPDRDVFIARACKEALHETGHTFGLVHCRDRNCPMALATDIRQIDLKHATFCLSCAAQLRRRSTERRT